MSADVGPHPGFGVRLRVFRERPPAEPHPSPRHSYYRAGCIAQSFCCVRKLDTTLRPSAAVSATKGLSAASIKKAASRIAVSFAFWSFGMKSVERQNLPDLGKRGQPGGEKPFASAADGASTSMVLGDVPGSFARSRSVETDSTSWLRRSSGSKSKLTNGTQAKATRPATTKPNDDLPAIANKKPVDTGERRKSDLRVFARWTHELDQRWKHRDRKNECDDHADAGDQPQFGDASIGCRQEREKAGCGCRGGERERLSPTPRPAPTKWLRPAFRHYAVPRDSGR